MKKEHLLFGGGLLVLAIVIYIIIERRKEEEDLLEKNRQNLSTENNMLKKHILNLNHEIKELIDTKEELPKEVKSKLKALVDEYKGIDEKMANELLSVNALLDMKEETTAVMKLAKIIENLLKKIYKDDADLRSNPRFVDLINHAKHKNLIEKEEYHFLNGIREIRNEEAHNLAVKKSKNIISSSLSIGIFMIFKFSKIIKQL